MATPLRVCITGAAGQIAYSLLYNVARGDVFGPEQPISLMLLDIAPMMGVLEGVVMELQDCALPLLKDVVPTSDVAKGFADIDVCIMVGAMPRREGMERKDLLKANAKIFETQGQALDKYAKTTVKVLVVGNPANTNCLLCQRSAPSIPPSNFTCLTRLDQNRAQAQVAARLGAEPQAVRNVTIWGNHSSTQFPDVAHAFVQGRQGQCTPVGKAVADDDWLQGEFVETVQKRGAAVIAKRKLSSAMSAAKAIVDHLKSWWFGTPEGEWVSMGVVSEGWYSVEKGLVYSFPVRIQPGGQWEVVKDLDISEFARSKMEATAKELCEERDTAVSFLSGSS